MKHYSEHTINGMIHIAKSMFWALIALAMFTNMPTLVDYFTSLFIKK